MGTRQIVRAAVLLIGVVVLGYGFFAHSRAAFFIGILVILAAVLTGIVSIVFRDER